MKNEMHSEKIPTNPTETNQHQLIFDDWQVGVSKGLKKQKKTLLAPMLVECPGSEGYPTQSTATHIRNFSFFRF
jgi:hypothetical protein